MAYHSGYGAHGACGGRGAARSPRGKGRLPAAPGWRVSLGFLPSSTRQRVLDFALSADLRWGSDGTAGIPVPDPGTNGAASGTAFPCHDPAGSPTIAQGLRGPSRRLSHLFHLEMALPLSAPPSKLLTVQGCSETTSLEKAPGHPEAGSRVQALPQPFLCLHLAPLRRTPGEGMAVWAHAGYS